MIGVAALREHFAPSLQADGAHLFPPLACSLALNTTQLDHAAEGEAVVRYCDPPLFLFLLLIPADALDHSLPNPHIARNDTAESHKYHCKNSNHNNEDFALLRRCGRTTADGWILKDGQSIIAAVPAAFFLGVVEGI